MDRDPFERDGFLVLRGVVATDVAAELATALPDPPRGGLRRITERSAQAAEVVRSPGMRACVEQRLGPGARLVRAILFDKRPDANWAVGPHRDETIAVRERVDTPGFGPWSVKDDVVHVRPPRDVLDGMLTVRLHLDAADEHNGALLVWPGSHRRDQTEPETEPAVCAVGAGDVVLMRPTVLHASRKATCPSRRRVLHLEFTACPLPGQLEWAEA